MTSLILTAALISKGCPAHRARPLAEAILPAAHAHRVPALLLASVVIAETRGTCRDTARHEKNGGWSVSPFQIYCKPDDRLSACVGRFSKLRPAARRAAKLLALGRALCESGRYAWYCEKHWAGRYNPGSRRWLRATLRVWKQLRERQ